MYNELIHSGVMGMRWGRRSTSSKVSGLRQQNKKLKTKLNDTITKSENNKVKIDKAAKKAAKFRPYLTDIGKSVQREVGNHRRRVLSRTIRKDKNLTKTITKINKRLTTNAQSIKTMNTQIKNLKNTNTAAGKALVDRSFD